MDKSTNYGFSLPSRDTDDIADINVISDNFKQVDTILLQNKEYGDTQLGQLNGITMEYLANQITKTTSGKSRILCDYLAKSPQKIKVTVSAPNLFTSNIGKLTASGLYIKLGSVTAPETATYEITLSGYVEYPNSIYWSSSPWDGERSPGVTMHSGNGKYIEQLSEGETRYFYVNASAGVPLATLTKQSDAPALTVEGNNLVDLSVYADGGTSNGVTFTVDPVAGTVTANGTATDDAIFVFARPRLAAGTYTLSGCEYGSANTMFLAFTDAANNIDVGSGITCSFDKAEEATLFVLIKKGITCKNVVFKPQLEVGTTKSAFAPYSKDAIDVPENGILEIDSVYPRLSLSCDGMRIKATYGASVKAYTDVQINEFSKQFTDVSKEGQ